MWSSIFIRHKYESLFTSLTQHDLRPLLKSSLCVINSRGSLPVLGLQSMKALPEVES